MRELLFGILAFFSVLTEAWWIRDYLFPAMGAVLIGLTVLYLIKYTRATRLLAEQGKESNVLNAVVRVHEMLHDSKRYKLRTYLEEKFDTDLTTALSKAVAVTVSDISSLERFLGELGREQQPPAVKEYPQRFSAELGEQSQDKEGNALTRAEETLMSFGALATLVGEGLQSGLQVARAYKPLLLRTARHLVPFVAIRWLLHADMTYQSGYVALLDRVCVLEDLAQEEGPIGDAAQYLRQAMPERTAVPIEG